MTLMTSNDNFLNISTRLQPIKHDIWCGSRKIDYKPFSSAYCDDITLDFKYQRLGVSTQEWTLNTVPRPIYNPLTTLNYRIDIVCALRVPENRLLASPHGLIGQSFDGDGLPRFGMIDDYPYDKPDVAYFSTSAMAEGAIQGKPSDYVVEKTQLNYKYSRFNSTQRHVSSSNGLASASSELSLEMQRHIDHLQSRRLSECGTCTAAPEASPPPPPPP